MKILDKNSTNDSDLSEIFEVINSSTKAIKSKIKWIIAVSCLIGLCGGYFAYREPVTYTSTVTFIVEDAKGTSNFGNLASLAGQFGVDVSGGSSSNLLSGDNIILYFKSSSLAKEVLFSKLDKLSNVCLADIYSREYDLFNSRKDSSINFFKNMNNVNKVRFYDSLSQIIIENILKTQLKVSKTDRKASLIDVSVTMRNEQLSKIYCERLVNVAVNRYLNIKTQRQLQTVQKLQSRADSLSNLLKLETFSNAKIQNASSIMDINPLYKTSSNVGIEMSGREKILLSSMLSSVIQNLEVAKFNLSQETPVIQIIDTPILPLKINKESIIKRATFYFLISFLLGVIFISMIHLFKITLTRR